MRSSLSVCRLVCVLLCCSNMLYLQMYACVCIGASGCTCCGPLCGGVSSQLLLGVRLRDLGALACSHLILAEFIPLRPSGVSFSSIEDFILCLFGASWCAILASSIQPRHTAGTAEQSLRMGAQVFRDSFPISTHDATSGKLRDWTLQLSQELGGSNPCLQRRLRVNSGSCCSVSQTCFFKVICRPEGVLVKVS